jgi:hypothetical protein
MNNISICKKESIKITKNKKNLNENNKLIRVLNGKSKSIK